MTTRKHVRQRELTRLLRRLVEDCREPERLMELYYWSVEPELAEVMRQYMALPREVSASLHAFLMAAAEDPSSVNLRISGEGDMILSSPAVTALAKILGTSGPAMVH